ncbi:hypothetical protein BT69DRAFT_1236844 [Atractiella rhizophila]|nr:hypothetical protein BT69DRAFT_1236844 [Atractiella rhizophila]
MIGLLALLLSPAAAQTPQIDYSSLGLVLLTGSYSGLTFSGSSLSIPPTSANSTSILSRSADGTLSVLGSTNSGGSISVLCVSPDQGTLYVGGSFESVDGVQAKNVAKMGMGETEGRWLDMGGGLGGEVKTIECSDPDSVWAGGSFDGGVSVFSTQENTWSAPSFGGFNDAVDSISLSPDKSSIFFGGAFSVSFTGVPSSSSSSSSSATGSTIPASLGSSYTPISLNTSEYRDPTGPTTYISGFGRPQYVFCPGDVDGPGDSWWLVDGATGFFTVRLFRAVQAGGIRLGNTFIEGRGLKTFRLVSIPDNTVMNLTHYVDPSNPTTSALASCTECTLGHNSSIQYEDFLFSAPHLMTGFQLELLDHYGASAGLHLLQLLAPGSEVYADPTLNNSDESRACPATSLGNVAGGTSSSTTNGDWYTQQVVVDNVPGTLETILAADYSLSASAADSPSVTWKPWIAQSGAYEIFLRVPGCTNEETCGRRSSVLVTTVSSGATVGQQVVQEDNQDDASVLVYNGTLIAGGTTEVTLRLADNALRPSDGGSTAHYVADRIQVNALSSNGSSVTTLGRGVWEWVLTGEGQFDDGSVVSNVNTETLVQNGITGFDRIGGAIAARGEINAVQSLDGAVVVGGSFNYSNTTLGIQSDNFLVFIGGEDGVVSSPGGGLDGRVRSLTVLDGFVYAVGDFDASSDGATTKMGGVGRWQFSAKGGGAWEAIGNGEGFTGADAIGVTKFDNKNVIAVASTSGSALGVWDPDKKVWGVGTSQPFIVGNLTSVAALSANNTDTLLVAGRLTAVSQFSAPSGAFLSAPADGEDQPTIDPLQISFDEATTSSQRLSSRSEEADDLRVRSFVKEFAGMFFGGKRQASSAPAEDPASVQLPTPLPRSGSTPEILAAAFWDTNNGTQVIMGGRFTTEDGVVNVGIYDQDSDTLTTLPGSETITGRINSIIVVNDVAWIGGEFTDSINNRQGLVLFDMANSSWAQTLPALKGYTGADAIVEVIAASPSNDKKIVVAGNFAAAGSLNCFSVCLWDREVAQWSPLATGLQGTVGNVDFAGSNNQFLLAAGQFELNGTTAYVGKYDFESGVWLDIQGSTLPGPATAISANDFDENNVFVAGQILNSEDPYLWRWNGSAWSDVNKGILQTGTGVEQLRFVPLSSASAKTQSKVAKEEGSTAVQSDRMLVVSGALTMNDTSVSTALFDGLVFYPYLTAVASGGAAGVVNGLMFSASKFKLFDSHFLSVGIVILISIAISLGIVFFLVLLGLLVALCNRREEPSSYPIAPIRADEDINNAHQRPTSLLAAINAATAQVVSEKKDAKPQAAAYAGSENDHTQESTFPPAAHSAGLALGGAAVGVGVESEEGQDGPRIARARYSFHAENNDEIDVGEGEDLVVLDSSHDIWWFVQSAHDPNRRGVIPASYVF